MDLYKQAASLSVEGVVELLNWKNEAEPRLQELERQVAWFRRQLFGASSERRMLEALPPADQLGLGEQMLEPAPEPPGPSVSVKSYERTQRRRPAELDETDSRLKFDDTVPVEEVIVPNPDIEGLSEDEYEVVDHRVTHRLAQRSSYVVLKYVQSVVKLKDNPGLSCPPVPPAVIERSFADVSFLAGMVVDKFQYHLPLYRQHLRLQQAGIWLHRLTLTRQVHRVAELLEPIYAAVLSSVLTGDVLIMDESPTPAGRANGKMKQGYFWALYGDQDEVAFLFSPTRARSVIDQALESFAGTLVSDGYKAYESFARETAGVVHAQCWAHARRKFIEAEPVVPEKCARIIRLLQQLYQVEERARGKPKKLKQLRRECSRPIVDEIFNFLEAELAATVLLPSNPFVQAAEYTVARKHELSIFLENPDVPIDTNNVERQFRGPAVGRKNWMFNFTEVGARHGGVLYTLIQSCLPMYARTSTWSMSSSASTATRPSRSTCSRRGCGASASPKTLCGPTSAAKLPGYLKLAPATRTRSKHRLRIGVQNDGI